MNNTQSHVRIAVLMLVLTNVLWGISFPVMKMTNLVMEGVQVDSAQPVDGTAAWFYARSASFLVCVRFSVALPLLFIFYPRLLSGMTMRHWGWGLATGLGFSGGMILQNMALNDIPASRSGFLTSLTVVFTPILLLVLHRHIPRPTLVLGALCALLGTAVLTGIVVIGEYGLGLAPEWRSRLGWGDIATILAALFFAGQIILVDWASSLIPGNRLTPGMFLATLLVGLLIFSLTQLFAPLKSDRLDWPQWIGDVRFLGLTLLLSIVCTVIAFHFMNTYQPFVSPSEAAVIYALEPLFATMWAMCLPGWFSPILGLKYSAERPGWELIAGGLLLIAGNVLALWPESPSSGASLAGELDVRTPGV